MVKDLIGKLAEITGEVKPKNGTVKLQGVKGSQPNKAQTSKSVYKAGLAVD
jgi:hypothetical protein